MNDFVSRIEEVGAEEISKALPTLAKNEERILELIQECITAFKAKVCKILRQDAEGLFIILFEQRLLSFVFLNWSQLTQIRHLENWMNGGGGIFWLAYVFFPNV